MRTHAHTHMWWKQRLEVKKEKGGLKKLGEGEGGGNEFESRCQEKRASDIGRPLRGEQLRFCWEPVKGQAREFFWIPDGLAAEKILQLSEVRRKILTPSFSSDFISFQTE